MSLPIKRFFFKDDTIRTFHITRLTEEQIEEKVFLQKDKHHIDISKSHGMICLDPFCMAVWLPAEQLNLLDPQTVKIQFIKNGKLNASIKVSLIEKIGTEHGVLLLYKIEKIKNYQLGPLHRLVLFGYLLRSKKNTYHHREVISALYSYPRSIIIVSYRDVDYYNIFPMDIHAYIREEGLYILGLRTTNVTLDKILAAGKVVVCDTDSVDIKTVYDLGKHSSASPTPMNELPFGTTDSELFGFPVPDFVGSYKEIEIIQHKKMGYHMLMVGKVVNTKVIRPNPSSLYHVSFLEFQKSNYQSIEGLF
jgi:flavin reductase (DIM6/NTAB) family NADH-FMN oxidoreductase RutF